jgi:hypothetical protein
MTSMTVRSGMPCDSSAEALAEEPGNALRKRSSSPSARGDEGEGLAAWDGGEAVGDAVFAEAVDVWPAASCSVIALTINAAATITKRSDEIARRIANPERAPTT